MANNRRWAIPPIKEAVAHAYTIIWDEGCMFHINEAYCCKLCCVYSSSGSPIVAPAAEFRGSNLLRAAAVITVTVVVTIAEASALAPIAADLLPFSANNRRDTVPIACGGTGVVVLLGCAGLLPLLCTPDRVAS